MKDSTKYVYKALNCTCELRIHIYKLLCTFVLSIKLLCAGLKIISNYTLESAFSVRAMRTKAVNP